MWKQRVWERSTYWGTGWLGEFLPLLQCRCGGLKVLWQGQVTRKHFLDIFHVFVRHPKVVPAQKGMHVWHWKALKDKGMHLWYWRSQEIKYHQQSLWHAQWKFSFLMQIHSPSVLLLLIKTHTHKKQLLMQTLRYLSEHPGPGMKAVHRSRLSRWSVAFSTHSHSGSSLICAGPSSLSGKSSTCRNCLRGKHLSSDRNFVHLSACEKDACSCSCNINKVVKQGIPLFI